MTLTAGPNYRLLNSHKFADLVHSVDCSNAQTLKLSFTDAQSVKDAKAAWGWVNAAPANTLIYMVDGAGCGGEHGRLPYHVKSVSYDDASKSASFETFKVDDWEDFAAEASVNFSGLEVVGNQKRASVHKKVKISLEHAFTKHFFDADIGAAHISIDCDQCGSHGSLDTDITVSTSDGFHASALTTDGVNFRMALAVTASAAIHTKYLSGKFNIETFPLAKFKLGKIVEIQPEITVDFVLDVTDISGSIKTVFGAEVVIPDGQPISIGDGLSNLNPQFKRIGPTISGKVDATAKANPLFTLDLYGKILGKDVVGGIGLAAPTLTVKAGVDVNSPTKCGDNSLHYSLDLGVDVDTFYGFGKAKDEPHKKTVFTRSENLLQDCIAI